MMLEDRDLRQRDIIPPDRLAHCRVTVVGVGAIGRQIALQLAAMGVPALDLIDPDTVEPVNLACQAFLERDLGKPKVQATAELCRELHHGVRIKELPHRFRRGMEVGNVLFSCVDSIETRRLIWEAVQNRVAFFCDGRMSAEVIRCAGRLLHRIPGALSQNALWTRAGLYGSLHCQEHDLHRQHRGGADDRPVRPLAAPSAGGCRRDGQLAHIRMRDRRAVGGLNSQTPIANAR